MFLQHSQLPRSDTGNSASPSKSPTLVLEDSDSESITQEYLDSLIQNAKAEIASKRDKRRQQATQISEEEIVLDLEEKRSLPRLDPGPSLPPTYFKFGEDSLTPGILVKGVDVEKFAPAVPVPPPSALGKDEVLNKRQGKSRKATAGPDWFDMMAPSTEELPKLYREVEAMRLRNTLDPKKFYRKEEGEGKGIKGLPKYFSIETIIPESTPFGTPSYDNLPRRQRKRTIVDELVEDAEAKRYAKKKFLDLQVVRGARGRSTLAKKTIARKPRW